MKDTIGMWLLFLIPLAFIIVILGLITYFTQNFEGVASIGLLVLLTGFLIWSGREIVENKFMVITVLAIFVFLGVIFDGAGNFIYNKPIQMLCPSETYLSREVVISEDYEGNTVYTHIFSCFAENQEKAVKQFPVYQTFGIRLIEYILLGLALIGLSSLIFRVFPTKKK